MAKTNLGILIRCIVCIGFFFTAMAQELQFGIGQLSVIVTLISIFLGLFGPIVAKLYHKIPIQYIMGFGVVTCAISYYFLSITRHLIVLYLLAIIIGCSICCYAI